LYGWTQRTAENSYNQGGRAPYDDGGSIYMPDPAANNPDTGPYSGSLYGGKGSYVPKPSGKVHRPLKPAPPPPSLIGNVPQISQPGADVYLASVMRKRGGRVSGHQHLVDRLFKAIEKAKRVEGHRTSALLHQPDEMVAKALNVPQSVVHPPGRAGYDKPVDMETGRKRGEK
jgi:hypothetical protein